MCYIFLLHVIEHIRNCSNVLSVTDGTGIASRDCHNVHYAIGLSNKDDASIAYDEALCHYVNQLCAQNKLPPMVRLYWEPRPYTGNLLTFHLKRFA